MHSPRWLQTAQALSSFTNLPFPSTAMGTAPFATSGWYQMHNIKWHQHCAGPEGCFWPRYSALSPCPSPNITSVTAVQGWEQSPACSCLPSSSGTERHWAEQRELKCGLGRYNTGMAGTGQGKPDKDAGEEDSMSWAFCRVFCRKQNLQDRYQSHSQTVLISPSFPSFSTSPKTLMIFEYCWCLRVSFLVSMLWQIHMALPTIVPQISNISVAWGPFSPQNSLNCTA